MKKSILALAGIAFLSGIFSFVPKAVKKDVSSLTVNVEKSRIDWVASKASDFHTGIFPLKSGQVQVVRLRQLRLRQRDPGVLHR